jgi:hypothetical protein
LPDRGEAKQVKASSGIPAVNPQHSSLFGKTPISRGYIDFAPARSMRQPKGEG